jgi:catechol 2,3-dioxygenase-like lactoylglutathione lyase family enzyme
MSDKTVSKSGGLQRMADRSEPQPGDHARGDIAPASATTSALSTGDAGGLPYGLNIPRGTAVIKAEHTLDLQAFDHVALRVASIQRAETFYHEFFEMDVVARARRSADTWEIMPVDFNWTVGLNTGFYPELVVLRNGPVNLLLLNAGHGAVMNEPRLAHIGLRVSSQTLGFLRGTVLVRSYPVVQDDLHAFRFRDPYGITWHLTDTGS